MFVTNPLGAKLEQQIFEEGGGNTRGSASNINKDWNGVWEAAARRTSDGWTAEIAIPMVTLRSPDVPVQTWGINFSRSIRHKNEQVYWSPIPKPYSIMQVSLAGTVTGMTDINRGLDLRIKPYVTGGANTTGRRHSATDATKDIGVDVKYGLGHGLALDVTVNTDFAQAEVDEQQVNLTRFPLFFPEKRDFFLENSGQFTVGSQGLERADGPVLQPSHRPVGLRAADRHQGRRPHHGQGERQQHRRHGPADRVIRPQPGRELPRRALQQGHRPAFEDRRPVHQQGIDGLGARSTA